MPDRDHDLDRIVTIAEGHLASVREEQPDARLDTFVIVSIFNYDDEDGDEREGTAVAGESRRHYVKVGVLEQGLDHIYSIFDEEG